MDRLFLDANVLFSAAYAPVAGLQSLWKIPDTRLLTSAYAAEEARRNLNDTDQQARLRQLLADIEVSPRVTLRIVLDETIELPENDWPILAGAAQAHATHLITGDVRHFGKYFGATIAGSASRTAAQSAIEPRFRRHCRCRRRRYPGNSALPCLLRKSIEKTYG